MKKILVRIFDWFKTRRRLIAERDYAWNALDIVRTHLEITTPDTLSNLKDMVLRGKDSDPPRVMPGSDVGMGMLNIQHWATAALAQSFMGTLDDVPDAKNYLTITMQDPKTLGQIVVTIKRPFGMSPEEKVAKLEKELEEYKNGRQVQEVRSEATPGE